MRLHPIVKAKLEDQAAIMRRSVGYIVESMAKQLLKLPPWFTPGERVEEESEDPHERHP